MQSNLLLVLAFIGLTSGASFAQDSLVQKKREIFLGLGPASYRGDLGQPYASSALLVTLGLNFNANKRLHGNVYLSLGRVTGQELDYTPDQTGPTPATPNRFFSSPFIGLHYEAHYHLIDKKKLKVYLALGAGLFRFDPKDANDDSLIDQPNSRPLGEDYRNLVIQFPTQMGIKYYLPNAFALGVQAGWLNPITDHLDNLGEWGNRSGNDNILSLQFHIYVPL